MAYKYELIINGIRYKTNKSEFRPNIITMVIEDLPKLHSTHDTFEIKISKMKR